MLRFCSLYSGSSGNSSLVQSKDINILIDAGYENIEEKFRNLGAKIERVEE